MFIAPSKKRIIFSFFATFDGHSHITIALHVAIFTVHDNRNRGEKYMKYGKTKSALLSIATIMALGFTGCSNGSSTSVDSAGNTNGTSGVAGVGKSGSGAADDAAAGTPAFLDGPVEGITYHCMPSGKKSLTNDQGEFVCESGDTDVKFSLGKYPIGKALANGDMVTPVTLFPADTQSSVNLAQLLQTLDADNDPTNGIDLTTPEALRYIEILSDNAEDLKLTDSDFDEVLADVLGTEIVREERAHSAMNDYLANNGLTPAGELYRIESHFIVEYDDQNHSSISLNESYRYDANKAVSKKVGMDPTEIYTYTYTSTGAIATKTTEVQSPTYTYKVFYADPLGVDHNRTAVTISGLNASTYDKKTEIYTYNANNQISVIAEQHTAETYFSAIERHFEYNDAGQLTRKFTRYPTKAGPTAAQPGTEGHLDIDTLTISYYDDNRVEKINDVENKISTLYAYDTNKKIESRSTMAQYPAVPQQLSRKEYEYDDNGALLKLTDYDLQNDYVNITTYTYDVGKISSKKVEGYILINNYPVLELGDLQRTQTENRTYDVNGNITEIAITIKNEITGSEKTTTTTYTYNAQNKKLTRSVVGDFGNENTTYTYDQNGNLTEIKTTQDDGSRTEETIYWTNQYGAVNEDT